MKKKSLVVIAVLATLAMSIGMFAGCAPTSPDKYLDKMNTATVGTTETTLPVVGTTKVCINDDEFSFESKPLTFFIVKEDKKLVMYTKVIGLDWIRSEDSKDIEKKKKEQTDKTTAGTKKYSTNKDDYTIADGVWTHKAAKYTIKIEAGKLVIEEPSGLVKIVFNANKPNIAAPKEAKDATKK